MQTNVRSEAQQERITAGLPFVEALARRMVASMPHSIDLGDLVQDALSFGAGVNMAGISVNVAMTQMEHFDAVMRFSLGYQL